MLRLNCKILFHTAVRGNIKVTGDFLYLKGSTSVYSVLFLNFAGEGVGGRADASPIPGFPVPAQHPSEALLLRGPGAPLSPAPGVPASAEAHRSINLGSWVTPRGCPAADAADGGQNAPCRGSSATPSPSNRGLRVSGGAALGKLVFPVCSPVTSHPFLLVSGGFHIGRG